MGTPVLYWHWSAGSRAGRLIELMASNRAGCLSGGQPAFVLTVRLVFVFSSFWLIKNKIVYKVNSLLRYLYGARPFVLALKTCLLVYRSEERKLTIGPVCIRIEYKSVQFEFSFPPTGKSK